MRQRSWLFLGLLLGGSLLQPEATAARTKGAQIPPPTEERGLASWFRATRPRSAAHRTFPLGARVRVRGGNGKSVVVTIRSRGPFRAGRIIDLSHDAFRELGRLKTGLLRVRVELLPRPARR